MIFSFKPYWVGTTAKENSFRQELVEFSSRSSSLGDPTFEDFSGFIRELEKHLVDSFQEPVVPVFHGQRVSLVERSRRFPEVLSRGKIQVTIHVPEETSRLLDSLKESWEKLRKSTEETSGRRTSVERKFSVVSGNFKLPLLEQDVPEELSIGFGS